MDTGEGGGGGEEGGGGGGDDGGSLLEFTHHITTANRNPRGISDIFITADEFD